MAMARYITLALAAVALTCCANEHNLDPEQKEDKAAQQEASKEVESIDDAKCRSSGFQPGSSAYTQCRKELAIEHSIKE
jgi:PBP1b-binding outer membrane lipoprotein LpoB